MRFNQRKRKWANAILIFPLPPSLRFLGFWVICAILSFISLGSREQGERCIGFLGLLQQSSTDWVAWNNRNWFFRFQRQEVWSQDVRKADSLGALREHPSYAWLLARSGLLAILSVTGLAEASLQSVPSSSHSLLPTCIPVSKFPSFYKDTSHIWCKAHANPVWPHLN